MINKSLFGNNASQNKTVLGPSRFALFLPIYFAIQSYLYQFKKSKTYYKKRQSKVWCIYAFICLISLSVQPYDIAWVKPFTLGLTFPGGGFLYGIEGLVIGYSHILFAVSVLAFTFSLIIWFATGNIILPILTLVISAVASTWMIPLYQPTDIQSNLGTVALPATLSLLLFTIVNWPSAPKIRNSSTKVLPAKVEKTANDEISLTDLKRLQLLFDRALQPIDEFQGFEWRDQFQTAAVRYQINFLSYALSITQKNYCPAATAYFETAQNNLLEKQGNHRIWKYWVLENGWGNLRFDRDPVPKDNIMYTGFIGLQMALAGTQNPLELQHRGEKWKDYNLNEMSQILTEQYKNAPYGLIACEPNWIYPLCNLITALGIRGSDHQYKTQYWKEIAPRFREKLESEFLTTSGNFIAFRSSLTGFAPPSPGGAVMQAFPCLFLNGLYPDMADRQWENLRSDLEGKNWRRRFWPIDVGNYGFSRASSYAASAAAAVEMGDGAMAQELLQRLDAECPDQTDTSLPYRKNASLWAHSLEICARLGRKDGLRNMIDSNPSNDTQTGPYLSKAPYPDVLIASAKNEGQCLSLILHPANGPKKVTLEIAGLVKDRHYQTNIAETSFIRADHKGEVRLEAFLTGRTSLSLTPVI